MAGEHYNFQARVLLTGKDAEGRSTVVSDGITPLRVAAPAFTICDVWQTQSLPIPLDTGAPTGNVSIYPPSQGFVFRVCSFPPDSEYDKEKDYGASLAALQGKDTHREESELPGMHILDTLDIVTVISGELYVVMETGETLLRQGDSVVTRGVMHSWSNKTDKPVLIASVNMAAHRT